MELGGVTVERDVPVHMRDGVVLFADVYRPLGQGPFPVLLQRTPYNKSFAQTGVYLHPAWYARQGNIVVVQDVRGRFASGGVFEPYRHEASDGFDTIVWAAGLDGSIGKVGTYGFSYAGIVQLMAASLRPPGLAAAAVGTAGSDFYDGWTYRGGALQLAFILSWTIQALALSDAIRAGDRVAAERLADLGRKLPSAYCQPLSNWLESDELPHYLADWIKHDTRDDYWRSLEWSAVNYANLPCLHIGGWYDIFLAGTLTNFAQATGVSNGNQHLIVGPWQHVPWARLNGTIDSGRSADNIIDTMQVEWFGRHLLGKTGKADLPPVLYYMMGAKAWRQSATWPPADAEHRELFLRSSGRANSLSGDGALVDHPSTDDPPDIFIYDPTEPVQSLGGTSCCRSDIAPVGAFDQRPVEIRNDVLVYTTPPLDDDVEIVGAVDLILYAMTDAVDTDWTAKLVDVYPGGKAVNLCDGIIRARYRDSLSDPSPIEPFKVYKYHIALGATANRFRKGHAIRLEISSSNFPAYDINDNTGESATRRHPFDSRIATQAVFHDHERPSSLRFCTAPAKDNLRFPSRRTRTRTQKG